MHKATSSSHILVAGLGRLGAAVATRLLADGHQVSGIRRNPVPIPGITLYPQDLINDTITLPPTPVDLLIIILTPAARTEEAYQNSFIKAPRRLLDTMAKQQPLPPVIFVSSTAVFGETHGWVNEDTPTKPTTFNGRLLLDAERALQQRTPTTCLRFAGIHGAGDYWKKRAIAIARKEQSLPQAKWMNRIHQQDCIGLLHQVATQWLSGNKPPALIIGCDNRPVCNHQLLQQLAAQAGLELTLPETTHITGKRIESHFIKAESYVIKHLNG